MKLVVTVREAVAGTSLAYLGREAANFSSIDVCNHAPLRLPKMWDCSWLTLIWCSFSSWGREHVASDFAYIGCQYLSYDYLQPIPTLITQDARPNIVDAPLTLISRMGQGAFIYILWSQGWPVHPKITTTYHPQNFMINIRISVCDQI